MESGDEMKCIKSEKGFTLIEIILSILILSIISGVVIQLYIAAKDLSDRAKETDLAIITAGNAIELLKHSDHPLMALQHEFFELANMDNAASVEFLDQDTFNVVLYYDEDFVSCHELRARYNMVIILKKADQDTVIEEPLEGDLIRDSELLDIWVVVTKIEGDLVLAEHQLSHFYAYVR